MNYGIPYMGSKSKIVHLIRYILERHYDKKYFIDVFCGGFAVSHYVLSKSKMRVLANDKNPYVIAFLQKLIYEGLPDSVYDFVTRERFKDVLDNPQNYDDWYVGYVTTLWSFGNTQSTYLFGEQIEDLKQKMHNAVVFDEWHEDIAFIGDKIPQHIKDIDYKQNSGKRTKLLGIAKRYVKNIPHADSVQQLERLERAQQLEQLERLERAQRLKQLERTQQLEQLEWLDWSVFIESIGDNILKNAIIYCDPPYEDTGEYAINTFNHNDFWQWFRETPYCVYVSSYKAPDDIKPLNFELKNQLLSGGVGKTVKENIYWNGKGDPEPTMEDLLFNLG